MTGVFPLVGNGGGGEWFLWGRLPLSLLSRWRWGVQMSLGVKFNLSNQISFSPLCRWILDRPAKINAAWWQQLFWESQTNYVQGWKLLQVMRREQFGTLAISPGLMLKNFWAALLTLRLVKDNDNDKKKTILRKSTKTRTKKKTKTKGWCWRTSRQPC